MKNVFSLIILASLVFLCLGVGQTEAQVGVAISPGIIRVDEPLFPGAYYNLPSLQVINSGKEASDYGVELAKVAGLKELSPPVEFIDFNPKSFRLEPGASQTVSLGLSLPVKAKPGDYLAYIEAHPVSPDKEGVSIGIASAAKVYFTVKPANIFVAVFTAITSFFTTRAPISYIILGLVILGVVIFFLQRHFKFDLKIGRK